MFAATRVLLSGHSGTSQEVPFTTVKQDGPPRGGYPPINTRRSIPVRRGPPAVALLAGAGAVMAYGFMTLGGSNVDNRALKEERRDARVVVAPYLQAEQDHRFLLRQAEFADMEAASMPAGWEVGESVYNTKTRWSPPAQDTMPSISSQ